MALKLEITNTKNEFELGKFKSGVVEIEENLNAIKSNIKRFLRICKKANILPLELLVVQKKVSELE